MAPTQYGDSTHWRTIKRNASTIWENDTVVPAVESEYGNADVISGANRVDGYDIIITDVNGNLIPREIAYFSKGETKLQLFYRDPAQDTVSGGTTLYKQWGGATVNEANDPNVWQNIHGGSVNSSLISHFEESSGDLLDSSGNGNDGAVIGCTYEEDGKIGKSYGFGTNCVVTVDDADSLDITEKITLKFWMKRGLGTGYRLVLGKWGVDNYSYVVYLSNVNRLIFAVTEDGLPTTDRKDVTTVNAIPYDVQTQITATFNTLTQDMKIYVNSVEDWQVGAYNSNIASIYIGLEPVRFGYWGGGAYYKGKMDEVGILNGELSENQNKGQYDNQDGFSTNASITLGSINEFIGLSEISGTISVAFTLSGLLEGVGKLSGNIPIAFTLSGLLEGVGELIGNILIVFTSSGLLEGDGELSGNIPIIFIFSGSILEEGEMIIIPVENKIFIIPMDNKIINIKSDNRILIN